MSSESQPRGSKPITMLLKLLATLGLAGGGVALGVLMGRKLSGPRWDLVISYSGSFSFLTLVLANPFLGFLLWIILSPFFGSAYLHIQMGRGIPDLSLSRLVIAVLTALLMAQFATGRRRMVSVTRLDLFVLLSVTTLAISIWSAVSKAASLAWYFESFLMPALTYFVARNFITDARKLASVQRALVIVSVLIALVVIQEQAMGYSWFPTADVGSASYGKHLRRATGLLGNPAFTGVVIAMTVPFVWKAMLEHPRRGMRRLLLACLAISYAGLFLTYNRTSWVGGVVGIVLMLLFYPPFRRPFLKMLPVLALLGIIYWGRISSSYALTERLVATNPINSRLDSYKLAYKAFSQAPFMGIGFGNLWYVSGLATPHNTFLWMLVTAGLTGFLPYAGVFVSTMWTSWRHFRRANIQPGIDRGMIVGLWVATISYFGQCFAVDMLYGIYPNLIFYFIVGSVMGQHEMILSQAKRASRGESTIAS